MLKSIKPVACRSRAPIELSLLGRALSLLGFFGWRRKRMADIAQLGL